MKKGAYDLGRKSLYYIVVMIIIAVLFTYMMSSFSKYQVTRLSNLDKVTDFVMINNILGCISQKDADTGITDLYNINENMFKKEELLKCLGDSDFYKDKAIKLEVKKFKVETQEPFFGYSEYNKEVRYNNELAELKISIEKYPRIK